MYIKSLCCTLKIYAVLEFLVVQRVKHPVLSLQQLGSLLWHKFDSWNFCVRAIGKTKKKSSGVPSVALRLMDLTRIHEDVGLIPGLTQWVKGCCGCGVGR